MFVITDDNEDREPTIEAVTNVEQSKLAGILTVTMADGSLAAYGESGVYKTRQQAQARIDSGVGPTE